MNLLNNIQNFLSPVIAQGSSVVNSIAANLPAPIVDAVSKFANVVFSKYGATVVGGYAAYRLVNKHISLPQRRVVTNTSTQNSDGIVTEQKSASESRSSIKLTKNKFDLKSLAAVATIFVSAVFILKR